LVDPENPEVPEFDGISFCQSLFHRIEKKIDQGSGEGKGDSRKIFGQAVDKIGFGQCVLKMRVSGKAGFDSGDLILCEEGALFQ